MLKPASIKNQPHIRIASGNRRWGQDLRELWQYRELLLTFTYRDYRVRYAQTALGLLWALLQPLLGLAVLYLLFQRVLGSETAGINFFAYALSGLTLWNLFNFTVGQAAPALINAQRMLQKIYFPRIILPLSKCLVGFFEALVAFAILIVVAWSETEFQWWGLLWFPLLAIGVSLPALGLGLWVSALSIRFRDLQQVIPFVLQLLFFLTPVAYAPEMLTQILGPYASLAYLNPVTGWIELFRAGLFGLETHPATGLSLGVGLLLFLSGWWFFQKNESQMADYL